MTQPRACVATLTYRRPEGLRAIVQALRPQLADVPRSRLLIVDNDLVPSAKEAFQEVVGDDPRITYVHEPRPGIAAARNRALDEAGDDDLLVFIDDDEVPSEQWLRSLLHAWRATGAAAVVGPVVSVFGEQSDPWIADGAFFTRLRHRTGTSLTTAATNNLLLDLHQLAPFGLRFDEGFSTSGGSDTVFTRQLVAAGGRMVWCDEALVFDMVPPERASREWVRSRALRLGNSDSRAAVYLAPSGRRWSARLRATRRGALRLVAGGCRISLGVLLGSSLHRARGTRMMMRGLGMLRGAWGSFVDEYARS